MRAQTTYAIRDEIEYLERSIAEIDQRIERERKEMETALDLYQEGRYDLATRALFTLRERRRGYEAQRVELKALIGATNAQA